MTHAKHLLLGLLSLGLMSSISAMDSKTMDSKAMEGKKSISTDLNLRYRRLNPENETVHAFWVSLKEQDASEKQTSERFADDKARQTIRDLLVDALKSTITDAEVREQTINTCIEQLLIHGSTSFGYSETKGVKFEEKAE